MFGGHSLTIVRALALAAGLIFFGLPAAAEGVSATADTAGVARVPAAGVETAPAITDPATLGLGRGSRGPFAADRLQHASLAFASGLAAGLATEEPAAAAGFAIGLGVTKEMLDGRADWGDLAADLVGAALAAWVTHAVRR